MQFKRLYSTVVSGDFRTRASDLVPVREYRERVSLVIQHYSRGTIRINLEVRNPSYGGSMAASYITVASGRKAAGKR